MWQLFTISTLLSFFFLFFLISFNNISCASINPLSSSSYASVQITFWSENVLNKMPLAISAKLSPLTEQDSKYYYAKIISENNFKADAKLCAIAKLACFTRTYIRAYTSSPKLSSPLRAYIRIQYTHEEMEIDPFSFFRISILKEDNTIHVSGLNESLPYRAFLPPKIASKISLSSTESVMNIFPQSNNQDAINTTIFYCNAAPLKGELKNCAKSLEEMISFSKTALGTKKLISLTSESTRGSGEQLTIKKIKKFDVKNIVACHEMFLPFTTYFCHSVPSSRIYSVDFVERETKVPVNTIVAVCHMDTSSWPTSHVAFEILKFGPGQGEACHWMTSQIDLAWIAAGENV